MMKFFSSEKKSGAINDQIRQFFADYEQAITNFDSERVSASYAQCYIAADPNGATCVNNDNSFRVAIHQRRDFFAELGFKSAKTRVLSMNELDENYSMVKVHWQMLFEKTPGIPINAEFDITYFVFTKGDAPKIITYISHEDEEEVMQRLGLLPTT